MEENYVLRSPNCGTESMMMFHAEYEEEHFGSVLRNVTACQKCGHNHSDILTLTKGHSALMTRISSIEDLDMQIMKSGTGTLTMPEFGASITPGPYSEDYISNVERILQRLEDALSFMLSSANGDQLKKGERILKGNRRARELNPQFTFVVKDPVGNSTLLSSNPKISRKCTLTKRRLLLIKSGRYALSQINDR